MVDAFYDSVRADDILGPIFDGVAHTDWDAHLPKMYDFWSAVLFGEGGFKGNPLAVHLELAQRTTLGPREFDRWLALFQANVDRLFHGAGAREVKLRASRIADVMQHHLASR